MKFMKELTYYSKLYKQPPNIGEILEKQGEKWVVAAILSVEIRAGGLYIKYVVQPLGHRVEGSEKILRNQPVGEQCVFWHRTVNGKGKSISGKIVPAHLTYFEGRHYQIISLEGIYFEGTVLCVQCRALPIEPITQTAMEKQHRKEKQEKLGIHVIDGEER